jgi:hypothetical protein
MAAQQRLQGQPAWQQYEQQPPPRMLLQLHEQRITYNPDEAAAQTQWQPQDVTGGVMEQEYEALPQSRPPLLSRQPATSRVSQPALLMSSDAHPQHTTKSQPRTNPLQLQARRLPASRQSQSVLAVSLGARSDDGLSSALRLLKGQSAGRAIAH